ncbi:MAG: VOC family protein, partial [Candidatus Eremiobacteraeota bacterium]|nr:VOC family protein [Candidatus Eremiobacteraeota bacterium]
MATDTATTLRKTVTGIDIAGYLVRDPQAAIAFYRDKLGIEPTEIDDQGRGAEFTLSDGTTFGVWNPPDDNAGGFVMFAVSNLQEAVQTYRSR